MLLSSAVFIILLKNRAPIKEDTQRVYYLAAWGVRAWLCLYKCFKGRGHTVLNHGIRVINFCSVEVRPPTTDVWGLYPAVQQECLFMPFLFRNYGVISCGSVWVIHLVEIYGVIPFIYGSVWSLSC